MNKESKISVPAAQRQLFLDDYAVAKVENLKRTMHQPRKKGAVIRVNYLAHPTRTVQTRAAPAWDPESRVFKFWVLGVGTNAGYMESPDGLRWNPGPEMNLDVWLAVRDPNDPDPARRYKAALLNCGFAVSPDGIRWTKLDVPAVSSSDEGNFSFDPKEGLFIHTVKRSGPHGRSVHLVTSRDFATWQDHGLIFCADDLDQELGRQNIQARLADARLLQPFRNDPAAYNVDVYNMGIFRYEGYYIGMPAVYHATGPIPNYPNTDGFHLVQLACSRDLKTWHRLGDRQAFIGPSPVGSGAYDLTQIIGPSDVVVRGDELWFYYTGLKYRASWRYVGQYPHGEHIRLPGLDPDQGAICLAVLRRDGFVSMEAGEIEGVLVTKSFAPSGSRLYVNVDAPEGELRVEVLSRSAKVLATSEPLMGDQPRGQVIWKKGKMRDTKGRKVSLRFRLRNAHLYSFWLEE